KNIRIESEDIARKLFGKNMYESPSKVETYHKCPFQYFCRYAIKAKKLEKSEIDARQRGSVIHYALENLIKIYNIKALCEMKDEKLREAIHNILLAYADENLGGLNNKTQRFIKLYSSFERAVYTLIKRLTEEFSLSKFEPVDFELKIDKDGEIRPIEIPISTGGVISLRGSIDRVDSFVMDGKNYIRVVDYKT
ncbi:MAG: PD-(D/E)XK nuclease family protein, partial [Clostridia bacterium]|nr:PD-(D/E)XK nuclease family protein [Clostridia bacterium]